MYLSVTDEVVKTLFIQSLQKSKFLSRESEREVLHKVNKRECEVLVERWQSEECFQAIMNFFSKTDSKL